MTHFARRSLFAYHWDIAEGDAAQNLSAIAALGIDTLSLALSYHAGKFIRPRGQSGKVVFPEDGTVYFAPDPSRYGAVKPLVNGGLARLDPVADWHEISGGLQLNAWTVLLHNTALGMTHPDCVARNAYGDPYWYALEPCHPDVADYAVGLASDLASRPAIGGLSLETPGYLPYVHGFHHEFQQVPLDPFVEVLLGLSFHPAAMKRAEADGVKAGAVRDGVRRALDLWFDQGRPVSPDMAMHWLMADLIADAELAAFLRWRARPVTEIVQRVRAAMPAGKRLAIIPSVQRPSAFGWLEGTDLAALSRIADRIEFCFYEPNTARVKADLFDGLRRIGDPSRIAGILRPAHPDLSGGAEIGEALAALRLGGVREIGFYNYGMMRRADLERLGAVLREEPA
jgi:hypothetical protein